MQMGVMVGNLLLALAALFLAAAVHPFFFYPLSLACFRRRLPVLTDPASAERPTLSVCMSCYNEEHVIRDKARDLIAAADAYGPAEILIYVDGMQDRTLEYLDEFRSRIKIVSSPERRGKTAGMKRLVGMSNSKLLAFTDANVITRPDSLIKLERALRDPAVGCAGARLVYSNSDESDTSMTGAAYWSIEESIKARESDTVGVVGIDGALFMIRRDVYEPPPDDIIDDLYVSLAALINGHHVVSVREVTVHERNATSPVEEFKRKARISCQAMNVHRLLWPRLRQLPAGVLYGYISHRLLKWLVPYMLLASAVCTLAGLAAMLGSLTIALVLLLAAGLYILGLAFRIRVVLRAGIYVMMLAGVGVGVFESLVLGRRYVVWQPAISVRA